MAASHEDVRAAARAPQRRRDDDAPGRRDRDAAGPRPSVHRQRTPVSAQRPPDLLDLNDLPDLNDLHDLPDEALARRAALHDRAAFAVVVERHGPALYRYASRMLADRHEVEDCLQEAFSSAWRALPDFRGDAALRTWLFTITGNAVRASLRRRRALPVDDDVLVPLVLQHGDDRDDPARAVLHADLVQALDQALRRLPERQRAVWLLREVEGLGYAEIGRVLATTTDSVRGQLHRARRTLETEMAPWR